MTLARFVIIPAAVGMPTIVTTARPPPATLPSSQITRLLAVTLLPWEAVAETRFKLAGNVSINRASFAPVGPVLVTVKV